MFSGVIICCNGIGDKSVTLGNQNNMSGVRGSPWDGLDRKIVLEKIENADSNIENDDFLVTSVFSCEDHKGVRGQ